MTDDDHETQDEYEDRKEQHARMTHGCCNDKVCTSATCMELPEGVHCGDCAWFDWCMKMLSRKQDSTSCDFFPRRFVRDEPGRPKMYLGGRRERNSDSV